MRITNISVRDTVLVLYQWMAHAGLGNAPQSAIIYPGKDFVSSQPVEILGTYKLVTCTKLVDDPSVCEVSDE